MQARRLLVGNFRSCQKRPILAAGDRDSYEEAAENGMRQTESEKSANLLSVWLLAALLQN